MNYFDKSVGEVLTITGADKDNGLTQGSLKKNFERYGKNLLSKKKKTSFFKRLIEALSEPMLIILLFSFFIAFGVSLGKFLKTGESDFAESFGILGAVILSVLITLIMEGSSEKAFNTLGKIYDRVTVKVIRGGQVITVSKEFVTINDIIILESGDKIIADGRLVESEGLSVDESALTGESVVAKKNADKILPATTPLAERVNCVYSGTFVASGWGKMLVTEIGDNTEIGKIAGELKSKKDISSPLQQKMAKLGKIITFIGVGFALFVFAISLVKLVLHGNLSYSNVQELFVNCIVLIVAAVPEGLPTIVAVSLALNMIKLASENALIKKMIATETSGAVSVICSDKTGTLTKNKMSVISICNGDFCLSPPVIKNPVLLQNFVCNSTADVLVKGKDLEYRGNGTECALIASILKGDKNFNYRAYRQGFKVISREPFSSDKKYMITVIEIEKGNRTLVKGAPEKVIEMCNLSESQKKKIYFDIRKKQENAGRVICFAHKDKNEFLYDGFALLYDEIRPEVYSAVKDCKRAGIKIKILTGDNSQTALAVARKLKICDSESQVINASEIESVDDKTLIKMLSKISVIARSTPMVKLRVVKALKSAGEVVAVTGDGINDAPAIKHADVGIAMGKSGSEITKESADVILLDDSFSTIVRAIAFGRNVYKNLQRFILFQLSVNVSALLFITYCAVVGLEPPFNTLQLLWINVIMDGPPALTLGLERFDEKSLMNNKPVNRADSIVSFSMLMRILFNGLFIGGLLCAQYTVNFLSVDKNQIKSATFTLFIMFQLFNAFNSRELGSQSIFKRLGNNKIMVITFLAVLVMQILIVQVGYPIFSLVPISLSAWVKLFLLSSSVVVVSEVGKLFYRAFIKDKKTYKKHTKKVLLNK